MSRTDLNISAIENRSDRWALSRLPPRASSSTSLAAVQSDRAALYMSPSARRCASFTGPFSPRCRRSARKRIDVSGDRRSCAISTTRSSPLGPLRQDARLSGSGSGRAAAAACVARQSTWRAAVIRMLCPLPVAAGALHRCAGFRLRRRLGLALHHPAGRWAALQSVPFHHAVQRGAVHPRHPSRLRHVAGCLVDEPRQVLALELRDHAVPRHVVRSEEHTSELQSPCNLVCRLLLEKKKKKR